MIDDDDNAPAEAGGDESALWSEVRKDREARERLENPDAAAAPAKAGARDQGEDDAPPDDGRADDGDDGDAASSFDWSAAPADVRAAIEKEREAIRQRYVGQLSGQGRRIAELEKRLRDATPPPAGPREEPPNEDLQRLREEFPEVADVILRQMDQQAKIIRDLQSNVSVLARGEQTRTEQMAAAERDRLLEQHPDFYDVLTQHGPEFQAWRQSEDLPTRFSRIYEENRSRVSNAAEAAEMFAAFKRDMGLAGSQQTTAAASSARTPNPQASMRSRQLRAASSPGTTGQRPSVATGATDEASDLWLSVAEERRRRKQRAG